MKAWMLALLSASSRRSVTETFTANAMWIAPLTTSRLDASGKGAAGSPGFTTTDNYWTSRSITTYYHRDGTVTYVEQQDNTHNSGTKPANYCEPMQTLSETDVGGAVYAQTQTCHYYDDHSDQITTPATTGAATAAFGRTFPGGTGGPANTNVQTNIPVTPGQSYSIVVPSGGALTITYTR